jgi:lysophospholipase L1-like esterase
LKKKYEQFNRKLKRWAKKRDHVKVVDVWTPLLGKDGKPRPAIYIEDGLHMNKDGYAIWTKIIAPLLKK